MKSLDLLRPTHIVKRVEGITPESLEHNNLGLSAMKGIAFDVDGTLTDYHETSIEEPVRRTLLALGDAGYRLYIISNAYHGRVNELKNMFEQSELRMKVIAPAAITPHGEDSKHYRKPKPLMLQHAMNEVGGGILMVGDQMGKDIVSANRAGMPSILVPRLGSGDDWRVKRFQRPAEALYRRVSGLPFTADDYPDTVTTA